MSQSADKLLKIIHDTKAVSIWNRETGPVFWYAAGVPGPFYVNTELVVGPELAAMLLEKITEIIAASNDPKTRVDALNKLILTAYKENPIYQQMIAAMLEKTNATFAKNSYDLISGGERRDWIFSIPLALELGLRHIFLFKNHTSYCTSAVQAGEVTLHVADLINNGASYFDLWLPTLKKANLTCLGTICVNTRGKNGIQRLEANGQKVATINHIDLSFFQKSFESGLIDQNTYEELAIFFESAEKWGARYLLKNVDIYRISSLDRKSFDRLRTFFAQDPWHLRSGHEVFFSDIQKAIAANKAAA